MYETNSPSVFSTFIGLHGCEDAFILLVSTLATAHNVSNEEWRVNLNLSP